MVGNGPAFILIECVDEGVRQGTEERGVAVYSTTVRAQQTHEYHVILKMPTMGPAVRLLRSRPADGIGSGSGSGSGSQSGPQPDPPKSRDKSGATRG